MQHIPRSQVQFPYSGRKQSPDSTGIRWKRCVLSDAGGRDAEDIFLDRNDKFCAISKNSLTTPLHFSENTFSYFISSLQCSFVHRKKFLLHFCKASCGPQFRRIRQAHQFFCRTPVFFAILAACGMKAEAPELIFGTAMNATLIRPLFSGEYVQCRHHKHRGSHF